MSKLSIATRMTRRHCTLIRIIWPLHNYGWGVCTQELKFARWNLHLSAEIKANEPRSINPNIQKKLETVLMCNKSKCYGFSYTTWYIQHLNCSVGNSIVHSKQRKPIKNYQLNLTSTHYRWDEDIVHDSLGQGETHVAVLHSDGGRGAVHLLERHLGVLHESGGEIFFRPREYFRWW